jgi:hypothetical protein
VAAADDRAVADLRRGAPFRHGPRPITARLGDISISGRTRSSVAMLADALRVRRPSTDRISTCGCRDGS